MAESLEIVMKSDPTIGDTEQLEWLSESFVGLIIGKKGAGIKEIQEQFGVKVNFLGNQCVLFGHERGVDEAKKFIAEKVRKQEQWLVRKRGRGIQSCVPDDVLMQNGLWEVIDLHPKYYKCISDDHDIQTKYNIILRLRKTEEGKHIVVRGSEDAKSNVKEEFFRDFKLQQTELSKQKKKEYEEMLSGKDTIVMEIDPKYIPRIIGKEGSVKSTLEKKHNVVIVIDAKTNNIYIKGVESSRDKTKVDIEYLMFDNDKKETSGGGLKGSSRAVCFIGLDDNERVTLGTSNCNDKRHCQIVSAPSTCFDRTYDNIDGLKDLLSRPLERAKDEVDDDSSVLCDVMMHCGKIHYKMRPGSQEVSAIRSNVKNLDFEKLNDVKIDEIEGLPVLVEYIRYDFKIFASQPSTEVRCKIFVKDSKQGEPTFLDITETDVFPEEMLDLHVGPVYFCHPEHKLSRIDVIDPITNLTTRINISIIKPKEAFCSAVNIHIDFLRDFFDNISVTKCTGKVDLILPETPENYKITFLRCSKRRCHQLGKGCILRTSREEIKHHESNNTGGVSVDFYFKSEKLNKLLQSRCWSVDEVKIMLEEMLEFSGDIGQYLL